MDNAKYHRRLVEKFSTMDMRKDDVISYMTKYRTVLKTTPVKPVFSQKIRVANSPKKYVFDEMDQDAGYSVIRLPPYHSVFNPVEMVCSQLKHHTLNLKEVNHLKL